MSRGYASNLFFSSASFTDAHKMHSNKPTENEKCEKIIKKVKNAYIKFYCSSYLNVLVVQRFGVGLVIERSLFRLPARALSSQRQLSLPSLRGQG